MKVYHIVNQFGGKLDPTDGKFYQDFKPNYSTNKEYLEAMVGLKKHSGYNCEIVTTIVSDQELESILINNLLVL